GFWSLGPIGSGIVFGALDCISLLFLTNFQLGEWLRSLWAKRSLRVVGAPPQEAALEKKARDLKKQAKELQEEAERSGLGPDLQPVPEPTVRDLSVPQAKSARGKKGVPAEPA